MKKILLGLTAMALLGASSAFAVDVTPTGNTVPIKLTISPFASVTFGTVNQATASNNAPDATANVDVTVKANAAVTVITTVTPSAALDAADIDVEMVGTPFSSAIFPITGASVTENVQVKFTGLQDKSAATIVTAATLTVTVTAP